MEALFLKLVNMSMTAGWLVLAVIAVRLVFRRIPKWALCLLWGLVAFRLICPFSVESGLSLIPSQQPLPEEIICTAHPEIQSGVPVIDNTVNPILESSMTPAELTSANPTQIWAFILSHIWCFGLVAMLAYMTPKCIAARAMNIMMMMFIALES
jgi:beta-lactamase regulating signal transducer with metallopeptidase domain